MSIAVIGAGNFGTVIANLFATNGHDTKLWLRDVNQLEDILLHRENRRYLPGHTVLDKVHPTSQMDVALRDSKIVVVTVPSTSFRSVAKEIAGHAVDGTFCISGTKGIEAGTFRLMSQILKEEIPQCHEGVLSGPNLAEEIAAGLVAGTVIASSNEELIRQIQLKLQNDRFRVYASEDVFGVELGGALKNIYAIICGMAAKLELGSNAISMVITRSLAEMCRFAKSMGANPYTFLGLSGVGDLLATCTSNHSRNFQLGFRIASGMSLEDANKELGKLAEGVNTLDAVFKKKNESGVYMPLADALHRVLFQNVNLDDALSGLMRAASQVDVEFTLT